jgi:soluble lytic murein transglycosylase-like protein
MSTVQRAILPGVFLGVLFIFFLTGRAIRPQTANGETGSTILRQEIRINTEILTPVVENRVEPVSECNLSKKYPASIQKWCGMIEKNANQNQLNPNLVAAVMLQESGGNPNAYSKSGAVGLMQVMPKDGIAANFMCSGKPCFSNRPSMAQLYDPEFNISYGARMLAGLIQRHGAVREALKAYGPMNYGYIYADKVLAILNNYR